MRRLHHRHRRPGRLAYPLAAAVVLLTAPVAYLGWLVLTAPPGTGGTPSPLVRVGVSVLACAAPLLAVWLRGQVSNHPSTGGRPPRQPADPAGTTDPVGTVVPVVMAVPVGMADPGGTADPEHPADAGRLPGPERPDTGRHAAVAAALTEDRARIARELHDIVVRSLSAVALQSHGARSLVRSDPDRVERTLATITQTGRTAAVEVRRLIADLRADTEPDGPARLPDLTNLVDLVDEAGRLGLPVRVDTVGPPAPLPPEVSGSAYLIVREALTNVLRHGGGEARAQVLVAYLRDELRVEVADDGDGDGPTGGAAGPGRGLADLRGVVAAAGGRISAGPRVGGGFLVTAWLPYDAATPVAAHEAQLSTV